MFRARGRSVLPTGPLSSDDRRWISAGLVTIRRAARSVMLDWEWLIGDAVIGALLPEA